MGQPKDPDPEDAGVYRRPSSGEPFVIERPRHIGLGLAAGVAVLAGAFALVGTRLIPSSGAVVPAGAVVASSTAPAPAAPSNSSGEPYLHIDGANIIDGKVVLSDAKCYLSGIGIQWNGTSTISGQRIDFSAIPDQSTLGGPKKPLLWIHEITPDTWFNVHDGVAWDANAGMLRVTDQPVMTGNNGEGGTPTGRVTLAAPLACPK